MGMGMGMGVPMGNVFGQMTPHLQTGAPAPQPAHENNPATSSTHEQRIQLLKDLVELKNSGVLSEEEFVVEKLKVLGI